MLFAVIRVLGQYVISTLVSQQQYFPKRDVMNDSMLIKSLTYLGATPFFIALWFSWADQPFLGVMGAHWFISYALIILSFMAGTLWGQMVTASRHIKAIALATNCIVFAAWFAYLLAAVAVVLLILALGFIGLYLLEARVLKRLDRPAYYLDLRLKVTALVVCAHVLMFWQL